MPVKHGPGSGRKVASPYKLTHTHTHTHTHTPPHTLRDATGESGCSVAGEGVTMMREKKKKKGIVKGTDVMRCL